jgi:HD-GYP domain-containing protein (c-di-GMP phosphodiesterase class II)
MSFGVATMTKPDENIEDVLQKADDRMYLHKLKESKQVKMKMIAYLKKNLEEICCETRQHYERLKNLSFMLARKVELSPKSYRELELLCEFHDIGKAGIPKEILLKNGTLNYEEWEKVKRHSEIGCRIVSSFHDAGAVDDLVLYHHEGWDGSGYPRGLKGQEIPAAVRIFAIADAYDAMVNDKPYRKKMTKEQALMEIEKRAGKQFDPHLAYAFIEVMSEEDISDEKLSPGSNVLNYERLKG